MINIKFGSARETMRIAGPAIFENVMASASAMINTAMVGVLGSAAAATVGVNIAPTWALNSIPMGLCVGCTVMVARNIGAGHKDKANDVVNQSIGGVFLLALAISIALFYFSQYVPALVNADPLIREGAGVYLRILSLSIVPNFLGLACSGMLRGAGNTKTPMFAALMTNVITVCLNFFLIYQPLTVNLFNISFVLPRAGLGVQGAAISTAIAQTVFGILMLCILFSDTQKIRAKFNRIFSFTWETLRPILKVGLPAMGERLTISFGQLLFGATINSLGRDASSAHHIAVQAESISYMTAFGVSIASTTLVGQSLGRKDIDKARGYANTAILMGVIVGVASMMLFLLFPHALMRLFINEVAVIDMGASALRVFAPVVPFFCTMIVLTGILRGGGDTAFAFYAGLVGMWGIRIGAAYIAIHVLGWGFTGAWIAMGLDQMARFIILAFRYGRKKWLNTDDI